MSTFHPTVESLSSPRPGDPRSLLPVLEGNGRANVLNCAAWRGRVCQQSQDAYPSPTASHQSDPQEPPSVDAFGLPPFWGTRRDSDLTVALISAQRSERRAENKLIESRLRHINIEKELYSHMELRTCQRLRKADTSVGVTRGALHVSGLTPPGDDPDSATSSLSGDSDEEEFS